MNSSEVVLTVEPVCWIVLICLRVWLCLTDIDLYLDSRPNQIKM